MQLNVILVMMVGALLDGSAADGGRSALAASLQKLSVKQLNKMLKEKGRTCIGCTSKSDLIEELTRSVVVQVN